MSGLYIHLPFCHSKCAYCDFYSMPHRTSLAPQYISRILDELTHRAASYTDGFQTLYIGGGTPTILSVELLKHLIDGLEQRGVRVGELSEVTIEANPEDISKELLERLKALGITRISMGVQSLDDTQLRLIGRRHDVATTLRAMNLIASTMPDYSFDLIYGIPGQSIQSWHDTLLRTLDYRPTHLSAYILTYEPKTRLTAMRDKGIISPSSEEMISAMYDILTSTTAQYAFEHYEISNFATAGHRAIHNSYYWNLTPYLGLGTSAYSFDGKDRYYNNADINKYLQGISPIHEPETDTDRLNDYILSAIRTSDGIDLSYVDKQFGQHAAICVRKSSEPFITTGTIIISEDIVDSRESTNDIRNKNIISGNTSSNTSINTNTNISLRIPESHWLISDFIIRELLQ